MKKFDRAFLHQNDIARGIDGEYWIFIKRQKTNIPAKVPLLKKAIATIEKYEDRLKKEINPKLLPIYCNQKTNQYLKQIAKLAGIQKNLSFHVARHTFYLCYYCNVGKWGSH